MSYLESEQIGVRCTYMRGGTSKGVYFLEHDLPPAGARRDALLKRIMGTPDVMQIDGMGGTHLVTSKIAIVGPSSILDADIDYTFAQAELTEDVIDYTGNCGNISAGVGPFAIESGLVRPTGPVTQVRIHNTNTGKVMVAHCPVANGKPRVKGDYAIAGVPGTGAEIFLDYRLTVGAKTGRMLPTGNRVDVLELEDGTQLETTLCDVANTIAFVRARDIGFTGSELPEDINPHPQVVQKLREIRGKAAVKLGFTSDWRRVDQDTPFLPFVVFVAPPEGYTALSGTPTDADAMDLRARLVFMNRLHEAMAGTGSMCIAAASRVPGSIVNEALGGDGMTKETLSIGHPNGVMTVQVKSRPANNEEGVEIDGLGFSRTARKIMEGTVYVPASDAY